MPRLRPVPLKVDVAFGAFGVGKGAAKMPDEEVRKDTLMLADLRSAPQALLERCMARQEALTFCSAHKCPLTKRVER